MVSDDIVAYKFNIDVLRLVKEETTINVVECAHRFVAPDTFIKDATGGILGDFNAIICGGQAINLEEVKDNSKCFSLRDGQPIAKELSSARIGAATLSLANGKLLWVTGGVNSDPSSNLLATEFVTHLDESIPDSGSLLLPIHTLSHHCIVAIDATTSIIIGGENQQSGVDAMTWYYEWSNETARSHLGPSLNFARSKHTCAVLKDPVSATRRLVVAAGGKVGLDEDGRDVLTDSVEILVLDDIDDEKTWQLTTKPMPEKIANAASAMTADQLQMLVFGGTTDILDEGSASVFVLECSDGSCNSWTKLDLELRAPSANGLAFNMPVVFNDDTIATENNHNLNIQRAKEGSLACRYVVIPCQRFHCYR